MSDKLKRAAFQLLDMDCATCGSLVKESLERQRGVKAVKVNIMLSIFYVDYSPDEVSEDELERLLNKSGHKVLKLYTLKSNP
ncbi:heavy-metal-associated domain-containing protein [Candidatus Bathyarchaeota archaeon]|nr:heavy-metal-associated domain-containing protein [Candidatus Bathyarchaeota archaeon]